MGKELSLNILEIARKVKKLEESGGSGGGGEADDVTYDPTASHLEATNVQDAIDELSGEIAGLSADDVSYDGTDSGLSAVTVQGAIDETVNKIDNLNATQVMMSDGVTSVEDALLRIKKANISGTTSANGNIVVGNVTNITIISVHIDGDSGGSYNAVGQYATDRTYLHVYNDTGANASSKTISGYYYYVEES